MSEDATPYGSEIQTLIVLGKKEYTCQNKCFPLSSKEQICANKENMGLEMEVPGHQHS